MNTGPVLVDVAVKDLKGAALDWVVAQIEGRQVGILKAGLVFGVDCGCPCRYSSDWSQGGPLIHKYKVAVRPNDANRWMAYLPGDWLNGLHHDDEPLVVGCRAIVASVLGDIVKVPACLVMP